MFRSTFKKWTFFSKMTPRPAKWMIFSKRTKHSNNIYFPLLPTRQSDSKTEHSLKFMKMHRIKINIK